MQPTTATPAQSADNDQPDMSELEKHLTRASTKDASRDDVQATRKYLNDNPDICRTIGNLAANACDSVIDHMIFAPLKEVTRKYVESLKDDLAWRDSGPLERLLIEAIVINWLRFYALQDRIAHMTEHTFEQGQYYDKQLTRAHDRFMKSIETLAKVRKLARRTPELLGDISEGLTM